MKLKALELVFFFYATKKIKLAILEANQKQPLNKHKVTSKPKKTNFLFEPILYYYVENFQFKA